MKKATLLKPTISFLSFCNIVLDKLKKKDIADVVVELENFDEKLKLITTSGVRKKKQKITRNIRMMTYTIKTINQMYIKNTDKEKIISLVIAQKMLEESLNIHEKEKSAELAKKNYIDN